MSEFTPISTQEEFDKAIKSRLAQKDREAEEKYKDYLSPDKVSSLKEDYEKKLEEAKKSAKEAAEKLSAIDLTVSELTKRAEAAENSLLKNEIAYANNLPLELAGRLVGTTKEELTKDAETLAALLPTRTAGRQAPPLHSTNPAQQTKSLNDQALLGLLGQLKGETN